jgi:hypothetical protein
MWFLVGLCRKQEVWREGERVVMMLVELLCESR